MRSLEQYKLDAEQQERSERRARRLERRAEEEAKRRAAELQAADLRAHFESRIASLEAADYEHAENFALLVRKVGDIVEMFDDITRRIDVRREVAELKADLERKMKRRARGWRFAGEKKPPRATDGNNVAPFKPRQIG
jgi:hypothetical protein